MLIARSLAATFALAVGATLAFGVDLQWLQQPSPTPFVTGQQKQSHPAQPGARAADYPQGTDQNPFVVKRLDAEETTERSKQQADERHEKAANEWRLVEWTIVLAVATIVLAGVAGGQLYMFYRQLGMMREGIDDAKALASAAKDSADAAKASVVLAETTAKRQLRGYVSKRVDAASFVDDGDNCSVQIRIKNSGQTPAHEVHCWVRLRSYPIGLPSGFGFEEVPAEIVAPRFVIHPGGDFHTQSVDTDKPEGAAPISTARQGAFAELYLWGEIRYLDVFGDPHRTWFRMRRHQYLANGERMQTWIYEDTDNANGAN